MISQEEAKLVRDALIATARTSASLTRIIDRLQAFFPLDGAAVGRLSEDEVVLIDAFLKRFENVLAVAGKQVFRALLLIEEEDYRRMSAAEVLRTLESWGTLPSAERWLAAVATRNRIAHEYPEPPEVTADALNDAYRAAPDVLSQLQPVVERLRRRLDETSVEA